MTTRSPECRRPVAQLRRVVARINRWQPFMPHLRFAWLWDVPFVAVILALAVTSRDDAFPFTMCCLLAVSVVVQARYAANRIRRGQRP